MEIYQVLDEQHHPVFETSNYLSALEEAEILNQSFEDHYFYVEVADQKH
jgi:hypothetical protein